MARLRAANLKGWGFRCSCPESTILVNSLGRGGRPLQGPPAIARGGGKVLTETPVLELLLGPRGWRDTVRMMSWFAILAQDTEDIC